MGAVEEISYPEAKFAALDLRDSILVILSGGWTRALGRIPREQASKAHESSSRSRNGKANFAVQAPDDIARVSAMPSSLSINGLRQLHQNVRTRAQSAAQQPQEPNSKSCIMPVRRGNEARVGGRRGHFGRCDLILGPHPTAEAWRERRDRTA